MAKILIVDDSKMQAKALARLVEKLGHSALMVHGGKEALEIAEQEMPDLILMDVVMPDMNGFQATREISRKSATSHIPIILISGKSQETDKKWGFRQGAKGYVVKPVDPDILINTMAPLMEHQKTG